MITGYLVVLDEEDVNTDIIAGHIALQIDKFMDGDKPLFIMFKNEAITEFLKDIANLKLKMEEAKQDVSSDE